jgi:hypothetical protein
MEDVLEVYYLPYDLGYPVVCMDESSRQMNGGVREPIPYKPGQPVRVDDEYARNGVAEIFMEVEPPASKRHVAVTERRTRKVGRCRSSRCLMNVIPNAIKVRLVMDNLNAHNIASLYEAFKPKEAGRLRSVLTSAIRRSMEAGSAWRNSGLRMDST